MSNESIFDQQFQLFYFFIANVFFQLVKINFLVQLISNLKVFIYSALNIC